MLEEMWFKVTFDSIAICKSSVMWFYVWYYKLMNAIHKYDLWYLILGCCLVCIPGPLITITAVINLLQIIVYWSYVNDVEQTLFRLS